MLTPILRTFVVGGAALALVGCGGSSKSGTDGGADMAASLMCKGAPVAGAQDMHCYSDAGNLFVSVDEAQCTVDAGDDSGDGGSDFGDTMYNTTGNDDDCKYSVSYVVSSGGICENEDTYFTVTLKNAIAGTPVTGGTANGNTFRAEVFLTDTHRPTPRSRRRSTWAAASTRWARIRSMVRSVDGSLPLLRELHRTPTSPHGHAAFFVNVP